MSNGCIAKCLKAREQGFFHPKSCLTTYVSRRTLPHCTPGPVPWVLTNRLQGLCYHTHTADEKIVAQRMICPNTHTQEGSY